MDEAFAVELNDIDLCLRLREKGLRVLFTPQAELYHHESATRGTVVTDAVRAERELFCSRWSKILADDPFFNPNLSLTNVQRAPAFPPRVERPWRAHGN